MKALLLAAGKASRLGKLSAERPKCLQRLGGETLLDRLVGQLQSVGVTEFLINVHHLHEQVESHVRAAQWATQVTLAREETLLGTLGTVRANLDFFEGQSGWILHADNFIESPLHEFRRAFEVRHPDIHGAMLTFTTSEPSSCGIVEVDNDGVIQAFHEKACDPPSNQASAATYIFDEEVFNFVAQLDTSKTDLSLDLIPLLAGRLVAVLSSGKIIDIGTPAGLAAAQLLASEADGPNQLNDMV